MRPPREALGDGEARRDVLDHARAQKEKHVCVLLKERDRLEREVKALRRKGETPTPRKMAAPVTPTDLPSPVKMAALSPPRPLRVATPSPQKDALELLEGEGTPAKPTRALDLQAAAPLSEEIAERKKELRSSRPSSSARGEEQPSPRCATGTGRRRGARGRPCTRFPD